MCQHCHKPHDRKQNHGHTHDHTEGKSSLLTTYLREILTAVLLVAVILLQHSGIFNTLPEGWKEIAVLIAFIISLLPVGIPILKEMAGTWRGGSVMNEFTLMVAATVGAFVIGEYPEGVAVLLFYSFGEKMESSASRDVKRRIRKLLGKLPDEATVKDGDRYRKENPRDLHPGTILLVKPGERVAIDSSLLGTEEVEFDTSAITGESVPRAFKPGEEISSGMIPVDRAVEVRTMRPFSDSSMNRIMKMIEDAQASKSPTENMLRRITRWYTPLVFTLALLLFFIPWVVSAAQGESFEWMKWLRRSLVFLVCSCPCALVVSIPLSYFASLGNASRKGLLFKGSKYVDAMRDIDIIFFDKTGTLTTGEFHIASISPASGENTDDILTLAAALDAESSHPLARAITLAANEKNLKVPEASDVKTIPHGVEGKVGGKEIFLGSVKLMRKSGIEVPKSDSDASEICVAAGGRYLGSIFLLDNIKPEAADAISLLHSQGIKNVVILSGDKDEAVKRVAGEVGADSYIASMLPEGKQQAIMASRKEGHKVAFVGDGINDAPAIAASDVGVAMGSMGTDMAMESADVVISGDNLGKLPAAISLARKVRHVVVENVSFAMGVKALVMTLGAFGIASLWAAVFADSGVTLITILWTLMRLRK